VRENYLEEKEENEGSLSTSMILELKSGSLNASLIKMTYWNGYTPLNASFWM